MMTTKLNLYNYESMSIRKKLFVIFTSFFIISALVGGIVYFNESSDQLRIPLPSLGPPPAESTDGVASAAPLIIPVNEATDVTVTIQLTDSRLIPGSVNLQRLDANSKVLAVSGTLNDSGTNGDAVAGDKIFTIRKSFNETTTTPMYLRVSWALKGVLKRMMSNTLKIDVWKKFANGNFSFSYPTFGQSSQEIVNVKGEDTIIDIKLLSATIGDYVSQFGFTLHKNKDHSILTDWFLQNVDLSGTLLPRGVFIQQRLTNGMDVLINVGTIPDEHLETYGPVADFYGMSPDGGTIVILSKSQVNEFDLYGYSVDAQESLLLSILQSMQF